jgi:hypothetical protein
VNETPVFCVRSAPEPDRFALVDLLLTVPAVSVPLPESEADADRVTFVTLADNVPLPLKSTDRVNELDDCAVSVPSPDSPWVIDTAGVFVWLSVPVELSPTALVIAGVLL